MVDCGLEKWSVIASSVMAGEGLAALLNCSAAWALVLVVASSAGVCLCLPGMCCQYSTLSCADVHASCVFAVALALLSVMLQCCVPEGAPV
jgi:hypothetical protein